MENCIRIPQNRVMDFNQLIMMGHGRRESANAITNSGNIWSALDYLNRKPIETNNVPSNDILVDQGQTTGHVTSGENGMAPIWVWSINNCPHLTEEARLNKKLQIFVTVISTSLFKRRKFRISIPDHSFITHQYICTKNTFWYEFYICPCVLKLQWNLTLSIL